ncbi:hypothetical protein KAU33_03945 [Candidatus Dependentiae bacterium]|nr:hypothetical protein [Candidatus Dependentiae bacterium]
MSSTKTCPKCHETKPLNEFYKNKSTKDGRSCYCKECKKESDKKDYQIHREERKEKMKKNGRIWYRRIGRQKYEHQSMHENKSCSAYLGIVIAERLCRHLFNDVKVMPYGFPGYDFICNKGKLINVKSATITFTGKSKNPRWLFVINNNKIPDFFILIAFDNRTDLNPLHLWMIPGHILNNQGKASMSRSTIHKWSKWERDIKDAQLCCVELKNKKSIF